MDQKMQRLSQGDKVAAVSALALFACMFLSWFNWGYVAWNAWESLHFITPILSITIVATLGVSFVRASGRSLGDIPGGLVVFVLGCLAALLILFRLIDPISTAGVDGGSTSSSIEAGAFLAFFAAVGIAVGGYLDTNGEALVKLKRLFPNGAAAPGGFAPPTPPPPPRPGPAPASPPAPSAPAAPAPAAAEPVTPEPAVAKPAAPESAPPEPAVAKPASPEPAAPEPAAPGSAAPERAAPDSAATAPLAEPAAAEPRSVFCENCGAPLRPKDRFCGKCGQEQPALSGSGGG